MTKPTASGGLDWYRTLSTGLLLGAATVFLVALLASIGSDRLASDFRAAYLPAAESVRAGGSPYVLPESAGGDGRLPYVYPPQLAIALVPLTVLPVDVGAFLALLVVPLALARPRFSALWLLPVVLWASPRAGHGEGVETILPAVVVTLVLAVLLSSFAPARRRAELPG